MITIISGVPGAGKSSVSRLLAEKVPRSVRLEGDAIGEDLIVNGVVLPGADPAEESERQLRLRRRNLCLLADSFAREGFSVFLDDVVLWPGLLDLYLAELHARPVRLVVLAPRPDVIARRDAGRHKHVFAQWKHLDDDLRAWTGQPGLRLDSSDQTLVQTVEAIEQHWAESLVDPVRGR